MKMLITLEPHYIFDQILYLYIFEIAREMTKKNAWIRTTVRQAVELLGHHVLYIYYLV